MFQQSGKRNDVNSPVVIIMASDTCSEKALKCSEIFSRSMISRRKNLKSLVVIGILQGSRTIYLFISSNCRETYPSPQPTFCPKRDVLSVNVGLGKGQVGSQQVSKTRTLHVHYAIQPSLHDCDMKLPNFRRLLHGVGEHNTNIFVFFFLNTDTVLSDSTQENFANF